MSRLISLLATCLLASFVSAHRRVAAAETLEQLVAGAKNEGDVTLLASASTFGGKKGFGEIEAGFNRKFGL